MTNTPWNERHAYVLDAARKHGCRCEPAAIRFGKAFHVSPFMGMDCDYDWRFTVPARARWSCTWRTTRAAGKLFDATLNLRRRDALRAALARTLLAYPLMTARVTAAIYLQAAQLWLKRTPLFVHP